MLTRLLHQCGLHLGPESDLMPAAADNPDGFWENLKFVSLNDEALNAVGAAWDLPPLQDETFVEEFLQPLQLKAQLLIDGFKAKPVWGWKDSRNCLTIRFWRHLIPTLKTVIIVRHPLEAAYSMNKRNGVSYALGLRLWEIYNRRLIATTDPDTRIISHYQTFFEDPEAELRRIAAFIDLTTEGITQAAGLVSTTRRHTQFSLEQMIDTGVAHSTIALYQELLEGMPSRLQSESQSSKDPLAGAAHRLNLGVPGAEAARQELATRRGAEIQQREEIARHQQVIENLRRELAVKSVTASAEINRRDGRIEELQKAYAHLDGVLRGEQEQRTKDLERTRAEWQELYQHWVEARNELETKSVTAAAEINRRDSRIEELQKAYAHLDDVLRGEQERTRAEWQELYQHWVEARNELEKLSQVQKDLAQVRERFVQTNQLLQKTTVRLNGFESTTIQLRDRLRKQLIEMKRILRFMDQTADAAERLRKSRRWKMANPFAALRAALTGQPLPGFGHLDRNVEKYRSWRPGYPETKELEKEIQELRPREILSPAPEIPAAIPSMASVESSISPAAIEFQRPAEPEISIIIPVHNQSRFTLACLQSVQQHTADLSYEVVVVDDCSSDNTPELMRQISGLTYLRSETNAGFVASCNRGAKAAKGTYLLFLNNDTTVTSNWLNSLLETFALDSKAGLVGSKLIYPDGRLQEAGGIIWRDGSGWNRGKYQDPNLPEYNYLREIDYCSAASVIIPKSLFEELGGFDQKYSPAYYEDTDLAFKVAQTGRKVFYQPLSVVIHHEGATAGTDTSTGAKRYQEINRATFVSSWADQLSAKPENGDIDAWDTPAKGRQRILVIDHHLPLADRDSGSLRMFQILSILCREGHRVTFIPDNLADIPPYGDKLRERGVEVVHHPYLKSVTDYLQTNGFKYDTVLLSRRDFARKHIDSVREHAPQAKLIFDTVDLHFLREEREAELRADASLQAKAAEMRQVEYGLIEAADETWVVSPIEQELLRSDLPHKPIEVVSNIVSIDESPMPFAGRRDLLFIGSFLHDPNIDAVIYFVQDILPAVIAHLPEAKFYVIGDKAPGEVIGLASEKVIITGHQADLRPYFDSARLSVAPLRYGAGVKGKINQSMGLGVPVVATSIAAEGMSLQPGKEIVIADTPAAFAEAIIKTYSSETDWNKLSENGREKTRALFSIAAARKQLKQLFDQGETIPGTAQIPRPDYPATPAMP